VVWLLRGRTAPSAVYGAVSFVALVLGCAAVSELRDGRRAALGAGLLAGIALGDCAYGLLVVSATTGWFYRPLIGLLGVAVPGRHPRAAQPAGRDGGAGRRGGRGRVLVAYNTLGAV